VNPYEVRSESLKQLGFESYADYLKSDLWRGIRQRVLDRDENHCWCCPKKARQVHHKSYALAVMEGKDLEPLISICRGCHKHIEFKDEGGKVGLQKANLRAIALMQSNLAKLDKKDKPTRQHKRRKKPRKSKAERRAARRLRNIKRQKRAKERRAQYANPPKPGRKKKYFDRNGRVVHGMRIDPHYIECMRVAREMCGGEWTPEAKEIAAKLRSERVHLTAMAG
jgi:hypothetical protein